MVAKVNGRNLFPHKLRSEYVLCLSFLKISRYISRYRWAAKKSTLLHGDSQPNQRDDVISTIKEKTTGFMNKLSGIRHHSCWRVLTVLIKGFSFINIDLRPYVIVECWKDRWSHKSLTIKVVQVRCPISQKGEMSVFIDFSKNLNHKYTFWIEIASWIAWIIARYRNARLSDY